MPLKEINPTAFIFACTIISVILAIVSAVISVKEQSASIRAARKEADENGSRKKLISKMVLGSVLSETIAIYGLIVIMIFLFVNPLISRYIKL